MDRRPAPETAQAPGSALIWSWCLLETSDDWRRSVARGRPIGLPNLERLFCRRWSRAAHELAVPLDGPTRAAWTAAGRAWLREEIRASQGSGGDRDLTRDRTCR